MMFKVGVIGFGVMGKNHVRILNSLENVELAGVFDPAGGRSELNGSNLVTKSVEELIDQTLDYLVIASPTRTHEEMMKIAIKKGTNFLVEKPFTHSLSSAIQIQKEVETKALIASVGHIERFNSAVVNAKRKILEGLLGKIYQIETYRQGPFPGRIVDVGVISDLATHDIDLVRWITDSEYSSVSASKTNKSGRDSEDLVLVMGTLNNGVIVSHSVNWLSPKKVRRVIITGERGLLEINTLDSELIFYENGVNRNLQSSLAHFKGVTQGEITHFSFDKPEPLFTEHVDFQNYIRGERNQQSNLTDGLMTMRTLDAIYQSAELKESVKLS
jgi:UDP-N-acetylglucosamine 3-dehydrogenase